MKRAALYTMVVLALALCPILTQAQTNKLLQANIPFDFTAGNTRMASGVYVIENASSGSHTQLVRNPETKAATFLLSNSMENPSADSSKHVLVFKVYGSEYVLTQIWSGGVGREVIQSNRVSKLAKAEQPKETIVAMQFGK
jgi:hypothetical protein